MQIKIHSMYEREKEMAKQRKIIQIQEKVPLSKGIPLSIQHTFAMFSASVLVPYILGISPSIALLMNGIGTLIFIFVTKGGAPAYLGPSFAFISPALIVISQPGLGYRYALGGFVVTGLLMCTVAIIIRFVGTRWIDAILPPAAMGPIVALIGLELAGSAAQTAGILDGDKNMVENIEAVAGAAAHGDIFVIFFDDVDLLEYRVSFVDIVNSFQSVRGSYLEALLRIRF